MSACSWYVLFTREVVPDPDPLPVVPISAEAAALSAVLPLDLLRRAAKTTKPPQRLPPKMAATREIRLTLSSSPFLPAAKEARYSLSDPQAVWQLAQYWFPQQCSPVLQHPGVPVQVCGVGVHASFTSPGAPRHSGAFAGDGQACVLHSDTSVTPASHTWLHARPPC